MRLKQFLNEDIDHEILDIIDILVNDCAPFINELRKGMGNDVRLMFSGIRGVGAKAIIQKTTPKNRSPRDTSRYAHDLFNKLAYKKFGWNIRSENVLFCTGSTRTASGYGKVYAIFPIGKFKYVWSEYIRDFYTFASDTIFKNPIEHPEDELMNAHYTDFIASGKKDLKKWFSNNIGDYGKILQKKTEEMYKNQEDKNIEILKNQLKYYKSTDLNKAIKSGNEIMVNCERYYGVFYGSINYNAIVKNRILERYIKKYGTKRPTMQMIQGLLK